MSPDMGPARPRENSPKVSSEDVCNFLAVTRPTLLTAPPEMIESARAHLEAEVAAGKLTRKDLDGYKTAAAEMGPILD